MLFSGMLFPTLDQETDTWCDFNFSMVLFSRSSNIEQAIEEAFKSGYFGFWVQCFSSELHTSVITIYMLYLRGLCESQSFILSFNCCVLKIHETKMPLICKSLAQGQRVPELLEAVVYGR